MSSVSFISSRKASPTRLLATAVGTALVAATATATAAAVPDVPGSAADADAAGVNELDSVKVQGQYQPQPVSPKFTASLLDTPRTVTVVPEALINDMGAVDLVEALRIVPGITFGAGEGGNPQGDRPYLRGYDAQNSVFVDGVRDVGAQSRETFDIQQIEVVRGPDSVYSGRSNGGGSINLVSKNPVAGNRTEVGLAVGSADYRRATIDSNVMIADDAALRINLMGHDAGVAGRDQVHSRRFGFAPAVTFGLNAPTSITLAFYHLNADELPDAGIPYLYGIGNLPAGVRLVEPTSGGNRDAFYGLADRDFRRSQSDIGTVQLRHEFDNGFTFRNTTRHGRSRQDYILSQPDDSQGNVINGKVWRRANTRAGNTMTTINQSDLSGSFNIASFKNEFNTGLELANEKSTHDSYVVPNLNAALACGQLGPGAGSYWNCTTLSTPDPFDPWVPGTLVNGVFVPSPITRSNKPIHTTADTQAVYALDTIHLGEQWLLNLGARYDRFSTAAPLTYCLGQPNQACPRGWSGPSETRRVRQSSGVWSWQGGVIFKPIEDTSVYFSYATSATPPGSFLGEGSDTNPISLQDLDPEKSRNLELGVKWNAFADRLSLSADLFETRKTNARQLDADGTYANIGKTRVRGIELSATGNISESWNVVAGYAFMKSRLVDGGYIAGKHNPLNGTALANVPQNSFSLWSTWQIAPTFSIGGGAFFVDDVAGSYRINAADGLVTEYGVPAYWRFDAMAAWKVNEHLDLRLNLNNLTDEIYYTKAYPVHFALEAPGRSLMLSANLTF